MRPRPAHFRWVVASAMAVWFGTACNSDPTVAVMTPVEVVIASGDGQFGVVGQELSAPLRVVVRSESTGSPRKDMSVVWDVAQGEATIIGAATTVTDSTGSTEARLRLGAVPGEVRVRAGVADQPEAAATFEVFAVNRPTLTGVVPTSGAARDTITLTGTGFSPIATQNVVLFSGIRGRVVSSTTESLQVEVPACLPATTVDVRMQLGAVPSASSLPFTVTGGGVVTNMQVGEVIDVADPQGFPCYALPGDPGAEFLALVYSASTVGAARHPFAFTALVSLLAPPPEPGAAPTRIREGEERLPDSDLQTLWDRRVRELEGQLLRAGRSAAGESAGPARVGPAAVPTVGERRTFNVLNASGEFDQVTAVARYIGTEVAIFVDEAAPAPGFSNTQLQQLAARFDQVIHPEVTSAFGRSSDLDANERVIILFTPAVNRLTPRGSSGFIGGFFYGIDLLPSSTGSNSGEIFYALVPDPNGLFSSPHTTEQVLQVIPAVWAHEFQHMVHFNERVLVREAEGQGALWLSEGLAQMAEEVVARAYEALNDDVSAELFRSGVRVRARRYLNAADPVSLVVSAGQGSLAERGAGFLDLLYLVDQEGVGLLGRLTRTTRTGVANVEAETGRAWADLLGDWWSATYLDGFASGTERLRYPTVDLRAFLGSPFPLEPVPVGPSGLSEEGSLWSSSVRYYLVTPPPGGTLSVRVGGEGGGGSPLQSALRLRLIRIS